MIHDYRKELIKNTHKKNFRRFLLINKTTLIFYLNFTSTSIRYKSQNSIDSLLDVPLVSVQCFRKIVEVTFTGWSLWLKIVSMIKTFYINLLYF